MAAFEWVSLHLAKNASAADRIAALGPFALGDAACTHTKRAPAASLSPLTQTLMHTTDPLTRPHSHVLLQQDACSTSHTHTHTPPLTCASTAQHTHSLSHTPTHTRFHSTTHTPTLTHPHSHALPQHNTHLHSHTPTHMCFHSRTHGLPQSHLLW